MATPARCVTPLAAQVRALERARGYELLDQAEAARKIEAAADTAGDGTAAVRAALVRADVLASTGDVETAGLLVQTAVRVAEETGDDELLARTHFLRSQLHLQAGDLAESRWHAVRAVEQLPDDAPGWLRAEHLLALSVVLDRAVDSHDAVLAEVLAIAAAEGDPRLELFGLNNSAWEHVTVGRLGEALRLTGRMRRVVATSGIPFRMADLDTIATVELRAGRPEEAWRTITQAFAPGCAGVGAEHEPTSRLTAFRILIDLGRVEEAFDELRTARALGVARHLPGMLADVEEADASYRAAIGDWEGAYRAHVRFHQEHVRLKDQQNAARVLLAQVQFDASTARRDRDRFRTLALTDSLTGLPNRRAVEEQVLQVLGGPGPVTVAIVDLDHFKRVNDEHSHDVGDAVLRELGVLLRRFADDAPGTFCARLGGEEFVVVWDGWALGSVVLSAEELRFEIEGHDWSPCVAGLPITISMGLAVTTTELPSTWSDLMARADARLYVAKRAGRNRVVGPQDVPAPVCPGR